MEERPEPNPDKPSAREISNLQAEVSTPEVTGSTPRAVLVDWANDQDSWVREVVRRVLATGAELTEADLDEIYPMFLLEKGMSEGTHETSPPLAVELGQTGDEPPLLLKALRDLKGVNALSDKYAIEFDDQLTVLLGQNGSGKTGYARVIKRAAAVRTHETILSNALAEGVQPTPSAVFEIQLDGNDQTLQWSNELGLGQLQRVSVFDAKSAQIHVDDELGYVYQPAELALFGHVTTAVQQIQDRADREVSGLRQGTRIDLSLFTRGTPVYAFVEGLSEASDLADLERLAAVPDTVDEDLAQLRAEVAALTGKTAEEQRQATNRFIRDLEQLDGVIEAVSPFNPAAYNVALASEETARKELARVRTELFQPGELAGDPDEDWQRFASAAADYQSHVGLEDYPHDGDACVYCRQPLGADAVALLTKYRTFLDETTQRQYVEARARVDALLLKVDIVQLGELRTAIENLPNDPSWAANALALLTDIEATTVETTARQTATERELGVRATELRAALAQSLARLRTHSKRLTDDLTNKAKVLPEKQRQLADLSDRYELRRRKDAVNTRLVNLKRASRLSKHVAAISSRIRRSLTEASKVASEDLVNRNFEELFAEECTALDAPKVGLTFQGRSGQAERRKAVARHRPSAILSEGEQKVLALADFLAESRMSGTTAPIVFDDPVTSLDYRRLDQVANRLHALAEKHQVVVFTHNIMFASALLALRQRKKQRVKFIQVRDTGAEKGVLAVDVEPRLDTPKDIAKRVAACIERAKKANPAAQDDLIGEAYDLIRSWTEVFVEQELLASVTQRYRANVMMTKLEAIRTGRLDAAIGVVAPMFEKVCRYIPGHSNPFEQSNVSPTLADLEADWAALTVARDVYLADESR